VEGCHDGRDEFSTQERYLGTVRVAKGKKTISYKWVFVKNQGSSDGNTVHYKGRLVVKGYAQ